jgi:CheY-like chemotaxis protein
MHTIRLLHIDDEPDIREIIEISLGLDRAFTTRSCESGAEGLIAAAEWSPDVILLDVMMPVMDGPATLAALREDPKTAGIPVIIMTARAQVRELDRFRALGAVGVIAKPFDPMTIAASVRSYLPQIAAPLDELRAGFLQRVKRDIAVLSEHRDALKDGTAAPRALAVIRHIAHRLSGAGGIYGFFELSNAAAAVEDATHVGPSIDQSSQVLSDALNHLIDSATFEAGPPGTLQQPIRVGA